MKNILVFSPFYKDHIGGLESFVEDFDSQLLNKRNIRITLVTSRIPKDQDEIENKNNLEILRLPFFELVHNFPIPKFWDYKFWKEYKKLFNRDYSVVLSNTRFFLTSLMAWFYKKRKNVIWIHIEHGSDFVQTDNFFIKYLSRIYDYLFGRLIFYKADKIISISEAVSNFVKSVSKRESYILYRGFNFSEIVNVSIDRNIVENYKGFVKILYVGRLISGKGVDDLLSSLEMIKSKRKWVCFVIGDGNSKNVLIKHSQSKSLRGKIVFLGKMEHNKTLSVMKTCDLIVNPSYTEGLPTVIVEAASLKKPIIATDVGGTRECFYKKISLFKPGEIDVLADKIKMFIDDSNVEYSLIKNSEYVINKFSWKYIVDTFLSFI